MKTASPIDIFKSRSLSKKYFVFIVISSLLILFILPGLLCTGVFSYVFFIEKSATENIYQRWLNENDLRVDFSIYEGRNEVREALLLKLPVGTPEEETQAFYIANTLQVSRPYGWKPENIESACWNTLRSYGFSCHYGVIIWVDETNRGHLLRRMFSGEYIIYFELDPDTHKLMDIQVGYFNGSVNL